MSSERFTVPDLALEEEVVFQNAFVKDIENLKANPVVSSTFCDQFVSVCKLSSMTLFTDKEAQTIFQIKDSNSKRLAVLKSVDEKGGEAMLMFYLLLHINNEGVYTELPSSTENDEKMAYIENLKSKSLSSIQNKIAEMQRSSSSFHSQAGPAKPQPSVATVRPLNINKKEEMDDASDDTDVLAGPEKATNREEVTTVKDRRDKKYTIEEEKSSARDIGTVEKHPAKPRRGGWGIKKDDEFFHFVIICFSMGAFLVAEFIYSDWTVAAGIGLMSFGILETFGIYFGLVHRIQKVAQDILPFFQKSPLGLKNQ